MSAGFRILVLCALLALVGGCANLGSKKQVLAAGSQVEVRSYQTRSYDTGDKQRVLRAVMSTLQDLRFVIDKADDVVGVVSATKLDGYALSMSVTVRPNGEQIVVRANAQYNLKAIEQPGPYQDFFAALDRGLFLDNNLLVERVDRPETAARQTAPAGADSVYEFFGEAEAEIDAGKQDRNLWARALVEVEGDEQKRKARYIELRAAGLYARKGARAATVASARPPPGKVTAIDNRAPAYLVSGTYDSSISYTKKRHGNNPRWYFGNNPRIQVDILQDGNSITATMSGDRSGQIEGSIDGDEISFDFFMKVPGATGKEGKGTWTLNRDLTSLDGNWTLDHQGNSLAGTWKLFKTDATPIKTRDAAVSNPAPTPAASTIPDVSGFYLADITSSTPHVFGQNQDRRLVVRLVQEGNKVTGTSDSKSKNWKVNGLLEGNRIVYYVSLNNGEIKGEWELGPGGKELVGSWSHPHGAGKWNLAKIH